MLKNCWMITNEVLQYLLLPKQSIQSFCRRTRSCIGITLLQEFFAASIVTHSKEGLLWREDVMQKRKPRLKIRARHGGPESTKASNSQILYPGHFMGWWYRWSNVCLTNKHYSILQQQGYYSQPMYMLKPHDAHWLCMRKHFSFLSAFDHRYYSCHEDISQDTKFSSKQWPAHDVNTHHMPRCMCTTRLEFMKLTRQITSMHPTQFKWLPNQKG